MYLDGSTGIVIGLLLGVLVNAIIAAILMHYVLELRRRVNGGGYGVDPLSAAWIFNLPQQRAGSLAIERYQPDPDSAALIAQTHAGDTQ